MTKQELINEFNNTKTICGIEISKEQKRALKYASIRLEQLDEPKECELTIFDNNGVKNFTYRLCSNCGYEKGRMLWNEFNYCPKCGAKIKKEMETQNVKN